MKEMLKELQSRHGEKKCVYCNKPLSSEYTDETTFDPESHGGIYRNAPQEWYPHYDIEFFCDCGYYEHYTHDEEGGILAYRINRVLYDFVTNQFSIQVGNEFKVAAKLPRSVEYGSDKWNQYLDKVLRKAYKMQPKNGALV